MTTLEKILQEIEENIHGIDEDLEIQVSGRVIDMLKTKKCTLREVRRIIKKYMTVEGSAENARPSRDNDKWIPCDPENIPDTEVLCCDEYGEELIGYLSNTAEGWVCESDECIMYYVVAWKPKPEPYIKDGE